MKKNVKPFTRAAFALLMLVSFWLTPVSAAEPNARTIVIFKIEGTAVTMTKGTAKEYTAKTGYKLYDGYTLSTGKDAYCYLKLDEDSVVKTDQSSKMAVSKASKDKLSLSVLSGGALVDAGKQAEGQVIETRVGNTGLTIRGTLYTIGHDENGRSVITMLSGSGDVDGTLLPAGSTMIVFDDVEMAEKVYAIVTADVGEMDLFTLQAVWEYQEILVESGIVTTEMLESIPALVQEKTKQMEDALPPPVIEPVVQHLDETPQSSDNAITSDDSAAATPKLQPSKKPSDAQDSEETPAPQPYVLTYHANGGSGTVAPETKPAGESFTIAGAAGLTPPAGKSGLTAWNTAADGTGTAYSPGESLTAAENVTLYAIWADVPSYTLTYNANGGSGTVASETKPAGESFTIAGAAGLTPPAGKSGLTAWNTAADGTGTPYSPGASLTAAGHVTLYAIWADLPSYTLTYNANGGGGTVAQETKLAGEMFTVAGAAGLTPPAGKSGLTAWNTAADGTGTAYSPGASLTAAGHITLYAIWADLPSYTLTYNANGGSGTVAPETKLAGEMFTVAGAAGLTPPAGKSGLAEWNTAADGTGTPYSPGASLTAAGHVTLYAIWADLPSYTLTYNANGGGGTVAPETKLAGEMFTIAGAAGLTPPSELEFEAWNTAADGTGTAYSPGASITANGNITLYAIWFDNLFTYTESNGELTITGYTKPESAGLTIPGTIGGKPVTAIGDLSFTGRTSLTGTLTIPDSVVSIGVNAFDGCTGFDHLILSNSLVSIGPYAFRNCTGFTGKLTIPDSVKNIGKSSFESCTGFTGLSLGNSVTDISENAFAGCTGLEGELIFPNSVGVIASYAFYNCSGLSGNLTIPSGVGIIYDYAFAGCSGFTSVTLHGSVWGICPGVFMNCSGLSAEIYIPASVTGIGSDAFTGCANLSSVFFAGNPPDLTNGTGIPVTVFNNMSNSFCIYYNDLATGWEAYKAASKLEGHNLFARTLPVSQLPQRTRQIY